MESNLPKVRAGFYLVGDDFDLDYVTKKLYVSPTSTRTKNDFPVSRMAHTSWELETEKEFCNAVCWQIEKLLDKLRGKENIISELCNELNLEAIFTIVVNMESGDGPELVLTKEIVSFIGAVNAEIGFDLYID
ncbi:DUF4279 domain-containing protein [Listeria booriae]|uniref:DUF4279 domain-containing protein n=1 Tax=Listeria booriae TaxID=1552123 RepID=A0A841Y1H3_9LIST|nr:DUF4279 domain-containing protein [Listeria booriae]MBC1317287.1 DUF4279 domain-containing protein [Listeria booriae]